MKNCINDPRYYYYYTGSLSADSPTFVEREADKTLYRLLKGGEYCFVLASRQMGKSTSRKKAIKRLKSDGIKCAGIDFTSILQKSNKQDSINNFYKNIIEKLWANFDLEKNASFESKSKYDLLINKYEATEGIQRAIFEEFINFILLKEISTQIVVFFDEIDSLFEFELLGDDLFTLIRSFHNQEKYSRLAFCFLGVASISDLIKSPKTTPFNVGESVDLEGFTFEQTKEPLGRGLVEFVNHPDTVLKDILNWTNGQPYLTQKLCSLVVKESNSRHPNIEELVRTHIIDKLSDSNIQKHFEPIRKRFLERDNSQILTELLNLYKRILECDEGVKYNNSSEQIELCLIGVARKDKDKIKVYNKIYKEIFDLELIDSEIKSLFLYPKEYEQWIDSRKKRKYLLRGKKLEELAKWAKSHTLSKEQELYLEASKNEEVSQLIKKSRTTYLALGAAFSLLTFVSARYYTNLKFNIMAMEARTISSESFDLANNNLDALKEALYANKESKPENNRFNLLKRKEMASVNKQASVALSNAIYSSNEYNRFSGHEDTVSEIAVRKTKNGNIIASGSWDKTIRLWKEDGTLIKTLGENLNNGHQQEVKAIAISPDGKMIVSGSTDKTIKLWKKDGTLVTTFGEHTEFIDEHTKPVEAIAFSPDGNIIASGSDDKTVKLWDINGELIDTIKQTETVKALTFSPDGKTIASGSEDSTIKLWDVDTRKEIKSLEGHQQGIREIAFTLDGKTIVSGSADSTLKLWDVDTGEEIKTFEGHDGPVYGIAINPKDNTIVSAGVDRTIRIWSIESGREISVLEGHEDRVEDVAVTPDGKTIISGSWDSTVRLWKPKHFLFETLVGHDDVVIGVDYYADNSSDLIASASDDRKVKLWRKDGTSIATFDEHTAEVYAVAISPDGKTIVSAGADNEIKLWNKDTKSAKTIGRHEAAIWDLAFTPDGQKIVSASSDNTLKIWDKNNNNPSKAEATLKGHEDVVWTVAISADGHTIISGGGDKTVRLWDLNGKLIETFEPEYKDKKGHGDAVWAVAASPDGQTIVSGGEDGKVIFWNRNNGKPIKEIDEESDGHSKAVKGIAIGQNEEHGELVASASADKTIKIWDKEGNLKKTISSHDGRIWDIAFSLDGRSLVSASEDKTLVVWNLEEILNLDEQEYGCQWIQNYLEHNSEVEEEERTICD